MKRYIESRPDVMKGALVIKGTRIPVSLILVRLKQGLTIKQVHEIYDWVPMSTLEGAIEELAATIDNTSNGGAILQA
jgi:uncharacterized protein (DUF433 family)